ncbi:MAG: BACON domain-containing protein [Prevotella sp.]|nr:BACON domain-containing protein [Prevotella sp.]
MRKVKLIAVLATALSLASCLGTDEPYTAGFVFIKPTANVTMLYANNTSDSIIFYSYGNWNLNTSAAMGGNWFSVAPTSGNGQVVYSLPVSFKQNTTGESRYGELRFTDTAHPGDANATLYFWQYATRGDGSLGNAADVKAISGTDGSHYEFSYDELHRPLSLKVSKDGTLLHSLSLSYNNADSILTVRD